MWAMLDVGFISVVQHDKDPNTLQVRARVKEDLLNVFGQDTEIIEIDGADYQFRANIPRDVVAQVMFDKVMDLDYTSHAKDVAIKRSAQVEGRSAAYYATWTAMSKLQPKRPYAGKQWTKSNWHGDDYLTSFRPSEASLASVGARPSGGIHSIPLDESYLTEEQEDVMREIARDIELAEEEKLSGPRICTVDHRDARKICEECGHTALVHPGLNDVDQCVICEMEAAWL